MTDDGNSSAAGGGEMNVGCSSEEAWWELSPAVLVLIIAF
jgi:hypothetical protein